MVFLKFFFLVIEFVRARKQPPMPYLPRVLVLGPYGSGRKTAVKKLVEKYHLREGILLSF